MLGNLPISEPGLLVFGGSIWTTFVLAELLSFGGMYVFARIKEHRGFWPPSSQFQAFIYGDTICLPLMMVAAYYLLRHMPQNNLASKSWWLTLVIIISIVVAVWLRRSDMNNPDFTRGMMRSPTKVYHDFFVVPVYIFLLVCYGLPSLIWARGYLDLKLAAIVLILLFAGLLVLDAQRKFPKGSHVDWKG